MPAAPKLREESGFALVDVLVGLAVLGLIGALLTNVLALAIGQRQRAAAVQRIGEASFAVSRLLHGLAEGAIPAHDRNRGWHVMQGKADELVILSMGPPVLALGEPARFTLTREKGPKGYDLLMTWSDPVLRRERREVVLADAAEMSFSYFVEQESQWSPETGRSGRIEALRLTIRFAAGSQVIHVIANLSSHLPAPCAADPSRTDCKEWSL